MKRPPDEALVDIQFRNGIIRRNELAKRWRFGQRTTGPCDWDIVKWQTSNTTQPRNA